MSKVRRIEITIETHEITRIHKARSRPGPEHGSEIWPVADVDPVPDILLFSESCSETKVSNPTPLAVDDHSHLPGKALNG